MRNCHSHRTGRQEALAGWMRNIVLYGLPHDRNLLSSSLPGARSFFDAWDSRHQENELLREIWDQAHYVPISALRLRMLLIGGESFCSGEEYSAAAALRRGPLFLHGETALEIPFLHRILHEFSGVFQVQFVHDFCAMPDHGMNTDKEKG